MMDVSDERLCDGLKLICCSFLMQLHSSIGITYHIEFVECVISEPGWATSI